MNIMFQDRKQYNATVWQDKIEKKITNSDLHLKWKQFRKRKKMYLKLSGGNFPRGTTVRGVNHPGAIFPDASVLEPLTRWPKPTKKEMIRLCLCHVILMHFLSCVSQTKKCLDSCFLQLILLFRGLFLLLIQQFLFNILLKV